MKKYIFIIIGMLMAFTASADVTIDNITYVLDDTNLEAKVKTSLNGVAFTDNKITIPETITSGDKTYKVTGVESFSNNGEKLELVLPQTVKYIKAVKSGIVTLNVPAAVTSITDMHQSADLQNFKVDGSNANYCDVDGVLFSKDKKTLVYMPFGRNSQANLGYTVPNGTEQIGEYAFFKMTNLATVQFSVGLSVIGKNAFEGCTGLQTMTFPAGMEEIGSYAFYGCTGLASVVFGEGLKTIKTYGFAKCYTLISVQFPNSLETIDDCAFYCTILEKVDLPENLQTIGWRAFVWWGKDNGIHHYEKHLQSIVVPAKVTKIGACAFGGYTYNERDEYFAENFSVDTIYVHMAPYVIPANAFGVLTKTTLVVPKGVRDIYSTTKGWRNMPYVIEGNWEPEFDKNAFSKGDESISEGMTICQDGITYKVYAKAGRHAHVYSNLTDYSKDVINLPEQIYFRANNYTLTGVEMFKSDRIVDLVLPQTITSIQTIKSGVKTLNVSAMVVSITDMHESSDLQDFKIDAGNTTYCDVDGVLFSKDKKTLLYMPYGRNTQDNMSVTLANGVEKIGSYAFSGMYNITRLQTTAELRIIDDYAFQGCTGLSRLNFSEGLEEIGNNAFYGCKNLVSIKFPEGLKTIKTYGFAKCYTLTSVQFPNSLETIDDCAFYCTILEKVDLPENLQTIGWRAFVWWGKDNGIHHYEKHLQSIVVPAKVTKIGACAFGGYTYNEGDEYFAGNFSADTIYSCIKEPMHISSNSFGTITNTVLMVPRGTKEEYLLFKGWKDFGDRIKEWDAPSPLDKICKTPVFTRKSNTLTLTTETEDASIYYTMDGKEPTKNSMLYDAASPIAPTKNCTVKAIAMKEGLDNSEVATYVVDWYKVEKPTFELNGTKLTIKTATEGASIYYTLGADAVPSATTGTLYSSPIELTDNRVVKAIGVKAGYDDSDIAEYSHGSVACPTPVFEKYDGRYFTIKPIDGAEIRYTTDGSTPTKTSALYDGRTAVPGLCTIKAMAFSDVKNPSDVASFKVTYFYSGKQAELTEAGTLEKTFEWCGTQGMTELEVNGPLNAADLTFIKEKLSTLQFLNLENATLADHQLPTEAFAGMQLVSFTSSKDINSVGDRIFANCQQLAAVVWNSSEKIPANSFGDKLNPNMLVYVTNKLFAPSGVQNVVANGTAAVIVLSDLEEGNGNFYCPVAFTAEKISYIHSYSQQTEVGKCMGWETIALPFTVQKIMHESKGEVIPFKQFEAEGSPTSARPFWLRALTATGFEDAATIEANIPYIISMPNSKDYADRYNLNGKITFSAEKANIPVTMENVVNKGNVYFVPSFFNVAKSNEVWPINKNVAYGGQPEGSVFVYNLRDVRPFEAYVTSKVMANMPMFLSIADMGGGNNGTTGISMMLSDKADLDGTWYSLDGRKLQGKPTIKGVYVNNGKKIVVR